MSGKRRRVSNPLALAVLASLRERPMHPYEMAATHAFAGQGAQHQAELRLPVHRGGRPGQARPDRGDGGQPGGAAPGADGVPPHRRGPRGAGGLADRAARHAPVKEYPQFEAALAEIADSVRTRCRDVLEHRVEALEEAVASNAPRPRSCAPGCRGCSCSRTSTTCAMREAELDWVRGLVERTGRRLIPRDGGMANWHRTGDMPTSRAECPHAVADVMSGGTDWPAEQAAKPGDQPPAGRERSRRTEARRRPAPGKVREHRTRGRPRTDPAATRSDRVVAAQRYSLSSARTGSAKPIQHGGSTDEYPGAGGGAWPAQAAALAIEARDLVKTYPKGVRALDGLSFSVAAGIDVRAARAERRGQVHHCEDPYHAGPGRFRVGAAVAGLDVRAPGRRGAPRHRGGRASDLGADPTATGRENLLLSGRIQGLRGRELGRRADELLARFDLAGAAGRMVRTYSGGMQRRLDVALGLIHRPEVLFLDEPTAGLDPESRSAMWDEIARLSAGEGLTILLTTHYLEEADRLASRWPSSSAAGCRGRHPGRAQRPAARRHRAGRTGRRPGLRRSWTPRWTGCPEIREASVTGTQVSARADDGATTVPALLSRSNRAGIGVRGDHRRPPVARRRVPAVHRAPFRRGREPGSRAASRPPARRRPHDPS